MIPVNFTPPPPDNLCKKEITEPFSRKGFWPPEAKVTVDRDLAPGVLKKMKIPMQSK
jgi:hypothetical protein